MRQPLSTSCKIGVWHKPTIGLKLNMDAACRPGAEFIGVGACTRDSEGIVLACLARRMFDTFSLHLAEGLALREGLAFTRSCGFKLNSVESDAANLVKAVNESD